VYDSPIETKIKNRHRRESIAVVTYR
jgi:hypothetical protein